MTAAIVTGGAGEIGAAICRRLARDGRPVVVVDLDGEAAGELAAEIGGEARPADVTDRAQVETIVGEVARRYGLGVLVNNAGIEGAVRLLEDYPEDEFERVLRTNVHSVFLGQRAALPYLKRQGSGVIVNIASTSGIRGRAHLAGYVASKHAVLGLTKVAALEVAGTGVRVNAVLPGPVATRMIRAIDEGARVLTGAEVKRAATVAEGTVDDVAAAVAHLVSPDARHLNGAEYVLDGGGTVA